MLDNKRLKMRCSCGAERVTDCDKCDQPTCRKCLQIAVEAPMANQVSIYHIDTCLPRRFRKEVQE